MALSDFTAAEIEEMKQKGIDPNTAVIIPPDKMSTTRALVNEAKARGFGWAGAGVGAMKGSKLGMKILGPPIVKAGGALVGAGIGAIAGGYGAGEVQKAVLPTSVEQQLQQRAAEAEQQYPYATTAENIAASALTSGGSFSPGTTIKAGRALLRPLIGQTISDADRLAASQIGREAVSPEGNALIDKQASENRALQNVGMQSTVVPAAMTGINYVATGQLPTGRDLIAQSIGAALFARPSALGRRFGGMQDTTEQQPQTSPDIIPTGLRAFPTKGMGQEYGNGRTEPKPEPLATHESDTIDKQVMGQDTTGMDRIANPVILDASGNPQSEVPGLPKQTVEQPKRTGMIQAQPLESNEEQPLFTHNAIKIIDNRFTPTASKGQVLGTIRNLLGENSSEWQMWKSLGIEQAYAPDAARLKQWMLDNGPVPEVHSYGMEGKVSEAKKEYDKMTHEWYETLNPTRRATYGNYLAGIDDPHYLEKQGWETDTIAKAEKYRELSYQAEKEKYDNSNPRATSYYSHVSALPSNEPMPDWTATKSGKNVQRVDVVVPQGKLEPDATMGGATDKPDMWPPDNLHENLPNTLGWAMIQYKTGPNGEKIALISEAQSRWGQSQREYHKSAEGYAKRNNISVEQAYNTPGFLNVKNQDHPLLRDYNRLILKAAIEQARKEGATHFVVSDAETAMMTEGHDAQHSQVQIGAKSYEEAKALADKSIPGYSTITKGNRPDTWLVNRISQDSGMRLNYDTILPKIAEELTGSKGERVSLGEHKNAYEQVGRPQDLHLLENEDYPWQNGPKRDNLIFHNADGTPKTDISGMMYPLGEAGVKRTTGEPFSAFGKKYTGDQTKSPLVSQESTPRDVVDHILATSNHPTVGSVCALMAQHTESDYAPLFKFMGENADADASKARINARWKGDTGYNPPNSTTGIPDTIDMEMTYAHHLPTVLEENAHAILSSKQPSSYAGARGANLLDRMNKYIADPKADPDWKVLTQCYLDMSHATGFHEELFGKIDLDAGTVKPGVAGNAMEARDALVSQGANRELAYKMGDFDEFMAGILHSKELQLLANETQFSGGGHSTVWQQLVNAISKILGIPVKYNSVLDRALRSSGELISQPRGQENASQIKSTEQMGKLPIRSQGLGEQGSERVEQSNEEGGNGEPPREGGKEVAQAGGEESRKSSNELRTVVPTDRYMGKLGMLTRAAIDKVRDLPHAGASKLADALKLTLNERDALIGHYKNTIITAGKDLNPRDLTRLNEIRNLEQTTGKSHAEMLNSPAQRNYYNVERRLYDESGKYAIANKIPVMAGSNPRLMRQDPMYRAGMANQKVEEIYRNNTDKEAIAKYDKLFDQWNQQKLGLKPEESKARINSWKASIQGTTRSSDLSHQDYFNALRKAQGEVLPPEFREQNVVKNDARYFDRFATSASHYKYIESNPEVMSTLGATKDAWLRDIPQHPEGSLANNPIVKGALDQFVTHSRIPSEQTEGSTSSLLTSAFIAGPPLEVHKLISNQVKALSFSDNPYQAVRAVGYALNHLKEGYIHATEGGVVKLTANSVKDMFSGTATASEKMQGLARGIRQVSTLNDLTTNFNAGFQQSFFECLIPSKIARANSGDKTAQMFLRNLDPTWTRGKTYDDKGMQQLASLATKYVHGTGDIRSMPAWMSNDGEISGFFQLAHWSVAQTNNFMKDVWTPATMGNYTPLIMSVFGSLAGGYIIKEIRTELQGKKSPIPSLSEISASSRGLSGNPGLLAYNAIAAMQYSGFGGLLSQVAKYPFDFVYKNTPQGATFPLDEVTTDLAGTLRSVSVAIANDPNINWVDLAQAVTMHTLTSNFALTRMAINQGINNGLITGLPAEKKMLSDKIAQLRRFDMTEGLPYAEADQGNTSYMNLEQKKFKMEQDLPTAMRELPPLINNIVQTYGDKPDVMMQKLRALKENSYSTFPSMEEMPLSFMKYITYLKNLKGDAAASQELQQYMQHKMINEVKSSAVP